MAVVDQIREKLTRVLSPLVMEILDESDLHRGHAGAQPGGETHFRLKITAQAFEGLSRLERHRLVTHALTQELAGPIHALSLEVRTPEEADKA